MSGLILQNSMVQKIIFVRNRIIKIKINSYLLSSILPLTWMKFLVWLGQVLWLMLNSIDNKALHTLSNLFYLHKSRYHHHLYRHASLVNPNKVPKRQNVLFPHKLIFKKVKLKSNLFLIKNYLLSRTLLLIKICLLMLASSFFHWKTFSFNDIYI